MQPPTTELEEAIRDGMDRLIELGGGTDDGVAEYLEDHEYAGDPSCAEACVIAQWIADQLLGRFAAVYYIGLSVYPNVKSYYAATVDWVEGDEADTERWTPLPPILNDVAEDFDSGEHPGLEHHDPKTAHAFIRDVVINA